MKLRFVNPFLIASAVFGFLALGVLLRVILLHPEEYAV